MGDIEIVTEAGVTIHPKTGGFIRDENGILLATDESGLRRYFFDEITKSFKVVDSSGLPFHDIFRYDYGTDSSDASRMCYYYKGCELKYVHIPRWDEQARVEKEKLERLRSMSSKERLRVLGLGTIKFNPPWGGLPIELLKPTRKRRHTFYDAYEYKILQEGYELGYFFVFQRSKSKVSLIATSDQVGVLSHQGMIGLSKFQVSKLGRTLSSQSPIAKALLDLAASRAGVPIGKLPSVHLHVDVPGMFYNQGSTFKGKELHWWKVEDGPIVICWEHSLGDFWVSNLSENPNKGREVETWPGSMYEVCPGVYFSYST